MSNIIIDNKIYGINYNICEKVIFVNAFYTKLNYRNRGFF